MNTTERKLMARLKKLEILTKHFCDKYNRKQLKKRTKNA